MFRTRREVNDAGRRALRAPRARGACAAVRALLKPAALVPALHVCVLLVRPVREPVVEVPALLVCELIVREGARAHRAGTGVA